jgi:hypothetical protein
MGSIVGTASLTIVPAAARKNIIQKSPVSSLNVTLQVEVPVSVGRSSFVLALHS